MNFHLIVFYDIFLLIRYSNVWIEKTAFYVPYVKFNIVIVMTATPYHVKSK